jgi:hypothetical protein
LIVSGWIVALSRLPVRGWVLPLLIAAIVMPVAWLLQDAQRHDLRTRTLARSNGYKTGHIPLAEWIAGKAEPGDWVALMDIGIVGYVCQEQRILDLTGLTDRYIAQSPGSFLSKTYDPAYVFDREPEFIVLALYCPGKSYTPPPPGVRFRNWTPMEAALARHPDFRRWYERKRPPPHAGADWLEGLSAALGADALFEHGYPDYRYFLALFQRKTTPEPGHTGSAPTRHGRGVG